MRKYREIAIHVKDRSDFYNTIHLLSIPSTWSWRYTIDGIMYFTLNLEEDELSYLRLKFGSLPTEINMDFISI